MSKVKDSPPTDNETEEEFSVEKVLDRRVVKGKVYIYTFIFVCIILLYQDFLF